MKKEVIFAILFGIIVGLVVMFGIYTANTALRQTTSQNAKQEATPPPLNKKEGLEQSSLTILTPENNLLTDKEKVTLSGKTYSEATVVVIVNEVENIVFADETGNFSFELSLNGGSNVIETISINKNGEQSKDTRIVVYSTADLDAPPATSSAKQTKANEGGAE